MNVPAIVHAALSPLVAGRVYPIVFPQSSSPIWPAIRYQVVSVTPVAALCGDGGDESAEWRVQLDAVATTYGGLRTLTALIVAVMAALDPPAIRETSGEERDEETGTYRCRLDYLIHPSSVTA